MASVREHYDELLGGFYVWMLGDLEQALAGAREELSALGLRRGSGRVAVDLGAGPGVHSIPLAELGYSVLAIDGCRELLDVLARRADGLPVRIELGDLLAFRARVGGPADVIVCMGDTLTHLESHAAVEALLDMVAGGLAPGGLFVATFRDLFTSALTGTARFLPVRSDEQRIHTCFLEYGEHTVMVHDVVYERAAEGGWHLRTSAFPKLRIDPGWARDHLARLGLDARLETGARGMLRLTARRPN
jgi:SAM-dependent methyltransferase